MQRCLSGRVTTQVRVGAAFEKKSHDVESTLKGVYCESSHIVGIPTDKGVWISTVLQARSDHGELRG